jgi:cobalt-precorrin 5A hydrolase
MIAAGFGFRTSATVASFRAALAATGQHPDVIATAEDKADAPALRDFAAMVGLAIMPIPLADLTPQNAITKAPNQPVRYGSLSLAEAAALAAVGPGGRLIVTRQIASDGRATIAIAEGASK